MGRIHKTLARVAFSKTSTFRPAVSLFLVAKRSLALSSPPASRKGLQKQPGGRRGAMEEQVVTERIRRKLEEVNATVQQHLAGVQDHVNFTMQVNSYGEGASWGDPPPRFCCPSRVRGVGEGGASSCGSLVGLVILDWW